MHLKKIFNEWKENLRKPAIWNAAKNFVSKKFWLIGAIVVFIILWGYFLGYYPIINKELPPSLPTNESIIQGATGEAIGLKCLRGEVFEDRMVQGDMLRCRIKFYNFNMSTIEDGFSIAVYGGRVGTGMNQEPIPEEDYSVNKEQYSVELYLRDFNQSEAEFLIKVPPVNSFSFFISGIKGYYNIPLNNGYISTRTDEYINNTLPKIQLLFLFLSVFVSAKYIRDLWRNK